MCSSDLDLLVLRESRSEFTRDNLLEVAGMQGKVRGLATWPGARCNADFCAIRLHRGGRDWDLLIGRGRDYVAERALAAACDQSDLVISDRWLPASCRPRWLKADRAYLEQSGGLAIDLSKGRIRSVAQGQGEHGWWHAPKRSGGPAQQRAGDASSPSQELTPQALPARSQ